MMQFQKKSKNFLQRITNRTKDLLFFSPFINLWRQRLNGKAIVYLYHRINSQGNYEFLDQGGSPTIHIDEFLADIQCLKKLGAVFIRFSDLAECKFEQDQFYVVLSIDDGFACDYHDGIAIADQTNVPLTIFQCSGMLQGKPLIWEHQLYYCYYHPDHGDDFRAECAAFGATCTSVRDHCHPKEIQQLISDFANERILLKEQLDELANQLYPSIAMLNSAQACGHEIASHGDLHFKRQSISDTEFDVQLERSLAQLNAVLDKPISAFSYPFNSYTETDKSVCAKYFEAVATVDGGLVDAKTDLLSVPRNTWPGRAKNKLRHRRWLLTGRI